jgi:hypothetical protein
MNGTEVLTAEIQLLIQTYASKGPQRQRLMARIGCANRAFHLFR